MDKKFNRIDPDDPPAKGALKLGINPFLIHTPDHNYLFDTGLGEFGEGTTCDTIRNNLQKHGLNEYDITDIFTSHLHVDHLGGLAERCSGFWELTFPDARLWVSRGGWQKILNHEQYYDEDVTEFIHFVDAKADIHYYEDHESPQPDIRTEHIGGHTEFHRVLYFESGEHKYLMAGDVIGKAGAINQRYAAKYDFEPKQSMKVREELARFAYENGYNLMGYHEPEHPIFYLENYQPRKGYTIKPAKTHVAS